MAFSPIAHQRPGSRLCTMPAGEHLKFLYLPAESNAVL